ncbi:putative holiday junction resolvase [Vibrio phage pVco-14]|nr:putative holiday junction resolvase [Vibrio phage pVco-14]
MVHVVNKGKAGEREAIKFIQPTIDKVYQMMGVDAVQLYRNQNQSALGGYDIDGLPWLALEIKRQEQLNLNKWWEQVNRAKRDGQVPVVMFRQNRKQWRFLIPAWLHTGGQGHMEVRAEITKEAFLEWFEQRLIYEIRKESECTEL